jgi:hypothetical protein
MGNIRIVEKMGYRQIVERWEIDRRIEPTTKQHYSIPFPLARKTKKNLTP